VFQLQAELLEEQRISSAQLDKLKRCMEAKLTMVSYLLMLCINWIFYLFYQELNKASQAAEREQEKLLKTKTTALQQVSNCNGVCLFEARASCT